MPISVALKTCVHSFITIGCLVKVRNRNKKTDFRMYNIIKEVGMVELTDRIAFLKFEIKCII